MNFEQWLLQTGKSARSAKSYSGAISGVISNWAKEAGLISDSLLHITSHKELTVIANELTKIEIFLERNTKGNGMYSSALNNYKAFLSDNSGEYIQEDIESIFYDSKIKETEKTTYINARVGQGIFRKHLIDYWNHCAVTGFSDTRFLVASHIKPWRDSDNNERLDSYNGLLLLPNIDKVFDLGFITFEEQGEIMLSSELHFANVLDISESMKINLSDRHQEYMDFHRKHVFERWR